MSQRRRLISWRIAILLFAGAVAAALVAELVHQHGTGTAEVRPHRRFRGHSGILREVAFSPDSRSFATSSVDGTVKIWSLPDARLVQVLEHPHGVTSVDFSDDGQRIVTGSYDGIVRVWRNGIVERALTGHTGTIWSVAFSPSGKLIASGGEDMTVRVWQTTGEPIHVLRGHERNVWSIAFTPDSRVLVSGGFDRTVRMWRTDTGALLRTLVGHQQAVVAVACSRDGKLIASAGDDSTVRLWRARDGVAERTLTGSDHVYSVAFSGDGHWLASGGRERGALGTLWKYLSGNRFRARNAPTVRVWRAIDGELAQELAIHSDDVWAVAISRDGEWLASNSADGTTALWSMSRLKQQV